MATTCKAKEYYRLLNKDKTAKHISDIPCAAYRIKINNCLASNVVHSFSMFIATSSVRIRNVPAIATNKAAAHDKRTQQHEVIRTVSITYSVLEAKLVSSCFNCPSNARPHLSLLLARRGVRVNTLLKVNPGPMGQPSLPDRTANNTN